MAIKPIPLKRLLRTGTVCLLFAIPAAQAAISTDGTLGPAHSLQGPDFQIDQSLGTLKGANLFHSFQTFDIQTGESASFTATVPLAHVISRVTGGNLSTIDGPLRSAIPGADFWFLNPAGVLFGPNASLDLPASFYVSTANTLHLADGGRFSASQPETSSLTIAPPAAFGFAAGSSAAIRAQGSFLNGMPGSVLALTAGDIALDGAALNVDRGVLRLLAVGEGERLIGVQEDAPSGLTGRLELTSAFATVGGDGGGSLLLAGGELILTDSGAGSFNYSDSAPLGGTTLIGNAIHLDHTLILGYSEGSGSSGPLRVEAGEGLTLANGAVIQNLTAGPGAAGELVIRAGRLEMASGTLIQTVTQGDGAGGALRVEAGSLFMDGAGADLPTWIATVADSGAGSAGALEVEVSGSIELRNGGLISSATYSGSSGNGGAVSVRAGSLRVDGEGGPNPTGIDATTTSISGDAGPIRVEVAEGLELLGGGAIQSGTFSTGSGAGSAVTVAAGTILLDGAGGQGYTGITSTASYGSGDAGALSVVSKGAMELRNGAVVASRTGEAALGAAGAVSVQAQSLRLDGNGLEEGSRIGSQSRADQGIGAAVEVRVADGLELVAGGAITSGVFAGAEGGSVWVEAGSLYIDGRGGQSATGIFSQVNTGGSGDAGALAVHIAGRAEIHGGGAISSATFDAGDGGDISVAMGELLIDGHDTISADLGIATGINSGASAGSRGAAGNLSLAVAGDLVIRGGGTVRAGTHNDQPAGTVEVAAGTLAIDGAGADAITGIFSESYADGSGDAGSVWVRVADHLDLLSGGEIGSSTYSAGRGGSVRVEAGSARILGLSDGTFTGISSQSAGTQAGDAGTLAVKVAGGLEILQGGDISTSSFGSGNAGRIEVEAGTILIRGDAGDWLTGIASQAEARPLDIPVGEAGDLRVAAGEIRIENNGQISSSVIGRSGGEAGQPHTVEIEAERLILTGGAFITTQSVGDRPAAAIRIRTGEYLWVDEGAITTQGFVSAAGGPIEIGGAPVVLQRGLVTTSVEGAQGNGGDIRIHTDGLVMDHGFIQANTDAPGASGGDIDIRVPALLVPEGQVLLIGGDERQQFDPYGGLDVIQAAAPDGVSGNIRLATASLDPGATVAAVEATPSRPVELRRDPCRMAPGAQPSSLACAGRQGWAREISDPLDW